MRRVHSIVLLLLIIISACRKEVDNNTVDPSSLIDRSRTYFEREVATKEDNRQMAAQNSKKNNRQLMMKSAVWKDAFIKKISIGEAVIVPLKYKQDLFTEINGAKEVLPLSKISYLIIYTDRQRVMKSEVVTWVPNSDYWQAKERWKKPFQGVIFVEDWFGNKIKGLSYNSNGSITNLINKAGKNTISVVDITCWNVPWYTCGTVPTYPELGTVCNIGGYDLVCTTTGFDDNPPPPLDETGGGGPAPGDYPPSEPDPCGGIGVSQKGDNISGVPSGCDDKPDCAGVIGGNAYLSDCGCIGGTTDILNCEDPCGEKRKISNEASSTVLNAQNLQILTNTQATGKEYGTERNLTTAFGNTYFNTLIRTDGQSGSFTPNFSWNSTSGYTIGASHGHPRGAAPSPADASWLYSNLSNPELTSAGIGSINHYKSNASVTAVTSTGNYVVTVNDWSALQVQNNAYNSSFYTDGNGKNQNYMNDNYGAIGNLYLSQNTLASPQEASAYALMAIFGNAIHLYKASAGSTSYVPLKITNGRVATRPCP